MITQVTNANVYVNGNSQLGRASTVKLPEVSAVMNEIKGLGMVGSIEVFAGFEKMEGEINWNSFYPDVFRSMNNPMRTLPLQVRANLQEVDSRGIMAEKALVILLNVSFKKSPLGEYKPQEKTEFSTPFAVHSVTQKIAGAEVLAFDPFNNIYRINGKDILGQYRANIGG